MILHGIEYQRPTSLNICAYWPIMWLTHFWHSWSQFFIFAWDVTAGVFLRTGVLICLVIIIIIIIIIIIKTYRKIMMQYVQCQCISTFDTFGRVSSICCHNNPPHHVWECFYDLRNTLLNALIPLFDFWLILTELKVPKCLCKSLQRLISEITVQQSSCLYRNTIKLWLWQAWVTWAGSHSMPRFLHIV